MTGGLAVAVPMRSGGDAVRVAILRDVSAPIEWCLPAGDVAAWLRSARVGDRLLYSQASNAMRGETASLLAQLHRDGLVFLFQPRSIDRRLFDFLVVKRLAPRIARPRGPLSDPATLVVFQRLCEAARRGERCPSDARLAALAGLTADQVKWRMKKLAKAGLLASELVPTVRDPRFRVVRILATGAETLRPEFRR